MALKILIACETSGRVRDAMIARGHNAISCDLLAAPGPHITGNAFDILGDGWDILIAHPTCTKLTVAAAWCVGHPKFPNRKQEQDQAAEDFMRFINAPIPSICVENPVGVMSTRYRKPDQTIQPYDFGEDASKRTCLWLKKLPLLTPTKRYPGRMVMHDGKMRERWSNQTDSGQNRLGPSADRWQKRSETYKGIAEAMAAQWL